MTTTRWRTGPAIPAPGLGTVQRGERVYASFVVRLWYAAGSRRLLRVELEHAQSGEVASARGVAVEWIGRGIAGLLADAAPPDRAGSDQDAPPD